MRWEGRRVQGLDYRGETLSAYRARQRKIPGWIVLFRENFAVNMRSYRKQTNEIVLGGFCVFSFSNFTFGFYGFHPKRVKNNSIRFLNWRAEENLAVNIRFSGK